MMGMLEATIMLSIIHLGSDSCAKSIQKDLEDTLGKSISFAAIYTVLSRLCDRGWLVCVKKRSDGSKHKAVKRFEVQPAGLEELSNLKVTFDKLFERVDI